MANSCVKVRFLCYQATLKEKEYFFRILFRNNLRLIASFYNTFAGFTSFFAEIDAKGSGTLNTFVGRSGTPRPDYLFI